MREYGQVQSAFWQSPDAQAWSDTGKLLALYLLTGPHANGLGCYRLPDGYVMADLGWDSERVSKGFEELFRNGFANRIDGVVLLPNFLRWNKIANGNIAKARFGEFESLPKGEAKTLAARAMLEFCQHWDDESKTVLETVCQTVSKRIPNQNPTQPNPTKKEPILAQQAERAFEDRFWPAYPRKVGREAALKAFVKLKPDAGLLDVMLKALAKQASSEQWRKDKQFIPHAATWINGKRWQDEPDEGGNYRAGDDTPDYLVGAV
jgi:hypothetical protein